MSSERETNLQDVVSGMREAHAYNAALMDALVDAVIQIDESAVIQLFNRSAERMFGWSAAEVVGHNVKMLMGASDAVHHDQSISRYLDGGAPRIIGIGREVTGRKKNGESFPIDLSVGEFESNGRRRFIGIIRDLSERKIIERALEKQQAQLQAMFEQAPVPIVTCDLEGSILGANSAFAELSGRRRSSMTGQALNTLFTGSGPGLHEHAMNALRDTQELVHKAELTLLRKDGSAVAVMAHYAQIAPPEQASMILIHIIDRTAEIAAENEARMHRERLAHVDRLSTMGELASGIAHEVNQPLTAISAYARACQRFYKDGKLDSEDFNDALEQIGVQADRAGKIVHRLRNFASRGEMQAEVLDVKALIDDVVGLVKSDLKAAGIEIEIDLEQALPAIKADEAQIQQVVVNLVRNAIESMQSLAIEERAMSILVERFDDEFAHIAVKDAGEGVPEQMRVSAFEPFATSKPSGMGLGLAISQSIVQTHGGELWFDSAGERGTRFSFTVPFASEANT